jgi:ABC-2 type transport system ATP-binding protein
MPDSFGTYPNMTCEEYLDFFARSYGLKGAQRRAALSEVISFTQLDQMAEKPVDGLSKGMKQRLCLGRALIHDPSVMILDEPAAGLDPRARIELREMIVRLAGNGKAVLISSHILTELAEMCDRVAIIELGQLLAVGNVDEIIRSSRTKVATSDDGLGADPHSVIIELVVLSDPAEAVGFLEQLPAIRHIKLFQKTILFQTVPDLEAQAELLAALIGRGVRVAQYRVKERSLEDAFLHVTRGQVQ